MYSAHTSGVDSGTIDPAALSSSDLAGTSSRGLKRDRSPDSFRPGDDGDPIPQGKRQRPSQSRASGHMPDAAGSAQFPRMSAIPPPHTPQSQASGLPATQSTPAYAAAPAPAPPKTTPTKSTLKALPTVRDHTTDQLNPARDEYVPREVDEFGEKKVMPNGQLLGNRTYRCRTFLVPNRGDKLFMLATECARVLGYRDSYLLFNKNRSLYKIIASQTEKDDLVAQEILPFSYRSRQIAIVTARSMFRQFGSRVVEGGRRVRDDYWEQKARKQGFTENDLAGEKRPGGAAKAREAAEAQNALMSGPHPEIVYNSTPGPYPGPPQPHLVPDITDTRPRDYSGIMKGGPRQEITGPPYQDQTRPSSLSEVHSQAHHAADFSRSVNQQRDIRGDFLQGIWRRPHEQPASSPSMSQPGGSGDSSLPATSRPTNSPHTAPTGMSQPSVGSAQSPQMMMTSPPYSQPLHAGSTLGQAPLRGSSSIGQGGANYNYQSGQPMWAQSPQTQHSYGSYTTQTGGQHPPQSPTPHMRQPSGSMQPGMQFPGMAGMQYGSQGMYADQTPRPYMAQSTPSNPAVTQPWSSQHSPPQQWWTPGQPQ